MKNLKKLAVAATFALFSTSAYADPYFGVGYQFNQTNLNTKTLTGFSVDLDNYLEKDFNNINLFAGYEFNKNVAVELGYFSKKDENKTNSSTGLIWNDSSGALTTQTKSDLQIINLDGIYSAPIASRLNFLAIASVSKIDFKYNVNYLDNGTSRLSDNISDNGFGFGGGIGLEAKIIENVSARITAKYTQTIGIDAFDNLVNYGAGLKYQF